MPPTSDNLQLALTLDLKPFLDALKNSEKFSKETVAEMQKLFSAVEPIKVDPKRNQAVTQSVSELKNEIMKYTTATGESAQSVSKWIEAQGLSEKVLRETIDLLKRERGELAYGSQAYNQHSNAIKNLENGVVALSARQGVAATQLGRTTGAVTTLNYIVRDSPFFFQRFDMGIMAISNNLNPFIDQLLMGRERLGSFRGAIKEVGAGLIGFGGLSFAFSLIVAAIQAFSFWQANAKRNTDALNGSIDEMRSKLEKASYETLRRMEVEARIKLLEEEAKKQEEIDQKFKDIRARQQYSIIDKSSINASEDTEKAIKNAKDQLDLVIKYKNELGIISQIENNIRELREKQSHSRNKDEIAQIEKEIEAQQKRLDVYKGTIKAEKDNIITFANEIRAEIQHIDVLLKGNINMIDRINLLEKRKSLLLELTSITSKYLDIQQRGIIKGKININDNGLSDAMQPIAPVPKPDVITESNLQLKTTLALTESLTDGFNSAGRAVSSAMGSSIGIFKQANSLVQIFINALIRATIEALILKGVTALLGLIPGFDSGGMAGEAKADGGLIYGKPGIDSNLARLTAGEYVIKAEQVRKHFPLIKAINEGRLPAFAYGGLNNQPFPSYNYGGSIGGNVIHHIIEIKGEDRFENGHIYRAYKKRADLLKKFK